MDKVEMSAVLVTARDGTTHAEPRHDARRTASRRTAYRIRNNLVSRGTPRGRCLRSVTGVRRPACELRGARIKQNKT
jgi:hypothetical protein